MRIEAGEHAVDRTFDQLRILDRFDIVRLHFEIDVHEARDFFLRLRIDARHRAGRERDERQRRKRGGALPQGEAAFRSEEHTSELQSLMRISYAVFCLKKKKN